MHESPKLTIGDFSIPYDQLVAWWHTGLDAELVYKYPTNSILTIKDGVYITSEVESIAEHLDQNAQKNSTSFPKELEPLLQKLDKNNQIPRCNEHYLHIKTGSFPLRHISHWKSENNWFTIHFTNHIRRTSLILKPTEISDEMMEKFKIAWFVNRCNLFLDDWYELNQKIKDPKIAKALSRYLNLPKSPDFIQEIKLLCELIKACDSAFSEQRIIDRLTTLASTQVEKRISELKLHQTDDIKKSFFAYHLKRIELFRKSLSPKDEKFIEKHYKLLNFISKLESHLTTPLIATWCNQEIESYLSDIHLVFKTPKTADEKLDLLLLELELQLHLCKNVDKCAIIHPFLNKITDHLAMVKKYPPMYVESLEIEYLCYFIDACLTLISNQSTIELCESEIENIITDNKLFQKPAVKLVQVINELLTKTTGCPSLIKKDTIAKYMNRINNHPKDKLSDDDVYALYQFVDYCICFINRTDATENELESKLKELNISLPQIETPQDKLNALLKKLEHEFSDTKDKLEFRCHTMRKYHYRIIHHKSTSDDEINKLCKLTEECIKLLNDSDHMSDWCIEQMDALIKELNIQFTVDLHKEAIYMLEYRISIEPKNQEKQNLEYYLDQLTQHPEVVLFVSDKLNQMLLDWAPPTIRKDLDDKIKELKFNDSMKRLNETTLKLKTELKKRRSFYKYQAIRKYYHRILNHSLTKTPDEINKITSLGEKCLEMLNHNADMTAWCLEKIQDHIKDIKIEFTSDPYHEILYVLKHVIKGEETTTAKSAAKHFKDQVTKHRHPEIISYVQSCVESFHHTWNKTACDKLDEKIKQITTNESKLESLLKTFENKITDNGSSWRCQVLCKYYYRISTFAKNNKSADQPLIDNLCLLIEKIIPLFSDGYTSTPDGCQKIENYIKKFKIDFPDDLLNELIYVLDHRINTTNLSREKKALQYFKLKLPQHKRPEILSYVQKCLENLYFNWDTEACQELDAKTNVEYKLNKFSEKLKSACLAKEFRTLVFEKYEYRIRKHLASSLIKDVNKICLLIEKCIKLIDDSNDTNYCRQQVDDYIKELKIDFADDQFNELIYLLDRRIKSKSFEESIKALQHFKEQITKHQKPELNSFALQCLENYQFNWNYTAIVKLDEKLIELKLKTPKELFDYLLKHFESLLKNNNHSFRYQVYRKYYYRIINFKTTSDDEINKLSEIIQKCLETIPWCSKTSECCKQIDALIKELKIKFPADTYNELQYVLDHRKEGTSNLNVIDAVKYFKSELTKHQQSEVPELLEFVQNCLDDYEFNWGQSAINKLTDKINEIQLKESKTKLQSLIKQFDTNVNARTNRFKSQVLLKYYYRIIHHPNTSIEEVNKLCLLVEKCLEMLKDEIGMTNFACAQIDNYIKELKINFADDDKYSELHYLLDFRIKHEMPYCIDALEHCKQQLTEHKQPEVFAFVEKCLETVLFNWGTVAIKVIDDEIKKLTKDNKLKNALKKFEEELSNPQIMNQFRLQVLRKYQYRIINHTSDDDVDKLCQVIDKCIEMIHITQHLTKWCCEQIDALIKQLNINFLTDTYNELQYLLDHKYNTRSDPLRIESVKHFKQVLTQHQQPEVPELFEFIQKCLEDWDFFWDKSAIKLLNDKINEINITQSKTKLQTSLKQFETEINGQPTRFKAQVFLKYYYRIIHHSNSSSDETNKLCLLIEKCLTMLKDEYAPTLHCCSQIDDYIKDLNINFTIDKYTELHYLLAFRIKHELSHRIEALKHYKSVLTQHQQPEVLAFVENALNDLFFNWATVAITQIDDEIKKLNSTQNNNKFNQLLQKFEEELTTPKNATQFRCQVLRKYKYRIDKYKPSSDAEKLCKLVEKCLEMLDVTSRDSKWCCEQIDALINEHKIEFPADTYNELQYVLNHTYGPDSSPIKIEAVEHFKQVLTQHQQPEVPKLFEFIRQCLENWFFVWDRSAIRLLDDKISEDNLYEFLNKFEKSLDDLPKKFRNFRAQVFSKYLYRVRNHKASSVEEVEKLRKVIQKCVDLIDSDHNTIICCDKIDALIKELGINFKSDASSEMIYMIDYTIKLEPKSKYLKAYEYTKQQIRQHQEPEVLSFIHECIHDWQYNWGLITAALDEKITKVQLNELKKLFKQLEDKINNDKNSYPLFLRYFYRISQHKQDSQLKELTQFIQQCIELYDDFNAAKITTFIKELKLEFSVNDHDELFFCLDHQIKKSTDQRREVLQKFKQQVINNQTIFTQHQELYTYAHKCLSLFDYKLPIDWCDQQLSQKIKEIKLLDLNSNLTKANQNIELVKFYYEKINQVKSTIDDLDKLKIIVCELTKDDVTYQSIDAKIKELKFDVLDTSDFFWTGSKMIPYKQIISWYHSSYNNNRVSIVIREDNKLQIRHTLIPITLQVINNIVKELNKNQLSPIHKKLLQLIKPPKEISNSGYLHLENCSVPIEYLTQDTTNDNLVFNDEFLLMTYNLKSPLNDALPKLKNCITLSHFINSLKNLKLLSPTQYDTVIKHVESLTPDNVMSKINRLQKAMNFYLGLSGDPITIVEQPTQPTPAAVEQPKESICTKEFSGQLFIVLCKEANTTFESIAQQIITEVGDKDRCKFLMFGQPGIVDWLWVSVEGMDQTQHNELYIKLFNTQKDNIRSSRYDHTAHISPGMLRNAKPFEFNVVPIGKSASFFIHGDSASDWESLHQGLIKELGNVRTLMFQSRKRGRVPGHTLYVCTKRMKFSSPQQLIQKIDTNNDFMILDTYTTEMIETIVSTWKHNDSNLVKQFINMTTQ